MNFSRSRHFTHKIFEAGLIAKAVERIVGDKPQRVDIKHLEDLADGGSVMHNLTSPLELAQVCDISKHYIDVSIRTSSGDYRSFSLKGSDGLIVGDVWADTVEGMKEIFDLLTSGLTLEEASDEIIAKKRGPTLKDVSERLAVIERFVLEPNRMLRCFLSYRFTSENEVPARKLHQFLVLLGIDVVTGDTYEPQPISQKVMERLKGDLDFIILLVCQDGESLWTRDEIATAKHKMIPLIPIVEEGVEFSSGLFGDLEYVPYSKGHIGDSFLKVLEAIKFVRHRRVPISSQSLK